jgi:ABC-type dipeptide/oligopeptide/nickel transport system permease subunit
MEFVSAALFALSSGLLFSERFKANRLMVVVAGVVALASTFLLVTQVLHTATRINERHALSHSRPPGVQTPALPQPAPGEVPSSSLGEQATQASYQFTQNTLDWIVRTGTGNPGATVTSDTVVGTIIAFMLAILASLGSMVSALVRRLIGRIAGPA